MKASMTIMRLSMGLLLALASAPALLAQDQLLELQAEYRDLYKSSHESVIMVSSNKIDPDDALGGTMSLSTQANTEVGFVVEGGYVICDVEDIWGQSRSGGDPRDDMKKVKRVWGRTASGQDFEMQVVGFDFSNLICVAKLPGHIDLPQLRLGDSEQTKPGETVAALGNGFDVMLVDQQVGFYMGTVSEITRFEPYNYYNTDEPGDPYKGSTLCFEGAVNPGDHGGPLINMRGEVIGMLSSHYHAGRRIGSAVPSSQFKIAFDAIVAGGKAPVSMLGFKVANANTAADKDAVLTSVNDNGPMAAGGLKKGDQIIMIDGFPIQGQDDLAQVVGYRFTMQEGSNRPLTYGLPPGALLLFTVKRGSIMLTCEVRAMAKP